MKLYELIQELEKLEKNGKRNHEITIYSEGIDCSLFKEQISIIDKYSKITFTVKTIERINMWE